MLSLGKAGTETMAYLVNVKQLCVVFGSALLLALQFCICFQTWPTFAMPCSTQTTFSHRQLDYLDQVDDGIEIDGCGLEVQTAYVQHLHRTDLQCDD